MNKFRIHTHRTMGSYGIHPIHLRSDSRSLEVVTVYNADNEHDWEGREIIYVSYEGLARAVYPMPRPPYTLRYQDITADDPWSPYKVSP